jgi:hypothetical protein
MQALQGKFMGIPPLGTPLLSTFRLYQWCSSPFCTSSHVQLEAFYSLPGLGTLGTCPKEGIIAVNPGITPGLITRVALKFIVAFLLPLELPNVNFISLSSPTFFLDFSCVVVITQQLQFI